mmetsp:Transcript_65942/g.121652  ORF Transcript_65942/g.121652 Transcript_65942/m.121652 type:complete len:517 (-) Transcript_65942:59-1609(-)
MANSSAAARDLQQAGYFNNLKCVSSCPLFSPLGEKELKDVQSKLKTLRLHHEDAVVFRSGEAANEMYFVEFGQVQIRTTDGVQLATVDQGGYFGELGVLFEGVRAADAVVSQGPCQLGVLSRDELQSLKGALGSKKWNKVLELGQDLAHVREWFVRRVPLFQSSTDDASFVSHVAQALQVRTTKSNDVLMREGEEGQDMLFIFQGSVEITSNRHNRKIQKSAPDYVGELALLFNAPRSATVKCATPCRLYSLERVALHRILQRFPDVIGRIYSTAQEASNLKEHFIRKIPLFQKLAHNEEFVQNLSWALQSESAGPNEYIVEEGASSDGRMFVIAHGHAEILQTKTPGESPVSVATFKAGDFFGEVALLLDTPRVASVVARGHCHLYTLSRDAFETIAVVYQNWWKELTSEQGALARQIKRTGVQIAATSKTQTHGLKLPQIKGVPASTLLNASQSVAADPRAIPQEKLCVVCRDNEKCMLSIPCGHIAACEACHEGLRSCPLCRVVITQGHKAFF